MVYSRHRITCLNQAKDARILDSLLTSLARGCQSNVLPPEGLNGESGRLNEMEAAEPHATHKSMLLSRRTQPLDSRIIPIFVVLEHLAFSTRSAALRPGLDLEAT